MIYTTALKVIKYPNPLLLEKSVDADLDDEATVAFIKDFQEFYKTLAGRAVGLAAPQVANNIRVFIALGDLFINPVIHNRSKGVYKAFEGCLSLEDGKSYEVERHDHITISWTDIDGKMYNKKFNNFLAEVIQHEYDHLDGILLNQ